jgi:DNA adenine methylase
VDPKIKNIPQAFPYQGSKRKLAPIIAHCIPRGTDRLIEPFAGSAAVSIAAAWCARAKSIWLNDAHIPLMNLWSRIVHDPEGLASQYKSIWEDQGGREKEHYNEIRSEFNRTQRPELLLFLLARCVKAAIRYNRNGQFNNSPDHRRKGMRPHTMADNIYLVSRILGPNTRITCHDYKVVLREARCHDLVYMDPPYQGVCKDRDSRYVQGVPFSEFVSELEDLNARGVPFVVSYDGRTGDRVYGSRLPPSLCLYHAELCVGRSTQETLLGRREDTYESLYLSKATVTGLGGIPSCLRTAKEPSTLFG